MEEKYVFGIDLGTTYSCISYFDENGQTVVCQNSEGVSTTPSVVRLERGTNPVIGMPAKNTAILYPDNTIQYVKSRIGKDASFCYGEGLTEITTPIAVSSLILRKLADDASKYTNSKVKRVVITVPAYFGDPERKATKQAGIDAGLDVLSIIEEPTAAAVYYGFSKSGNTENVLVFDLGGGTFDVTAMKITFDKRFVTLTTDGDYDLGGKNWDNALIELVKSKFEDETGYDGEYDNDIEQDLLISCEQAKIVLTSAEKASVTVNIDRQHRAAIEITRKEFDDVTSNLLDTAIERTKSVIGRISEPVNKILLVGGSTYMPQIHEAIKREFPSFEIYINEPNESVSKGASIFAYSQYAKSQNDDDFLPGSYDEDTLPSYDNIDSLVSNIPKIVTVTTKSIGVGCYRRELERDIVVNLIQKDTKLPASVVEYFYPVNDYQKNVCFRVFQSNNYDDVYEIDESLIIGEAVKKKKKHFMKSDNIKTTILVSEDGLIHLEAVNERTNEFVEVNIENDAYSV